MAQLASRHTPPSSWAEIASLLVLAPAMLWNALWLVALLRAGDGCDGGSCSTELIAVMFWGLGAAFLALPGVVAFGIALGGWARGGSTAARLAVASGAVSAVAAIAIVVLALTMIV